MNRWLKSLAFLCVILFSLTLLIFALRLALPGFWIIPDISSTKELNNLLMGFLQTVVAFFTLMVAAGTIFGFIFIKDATLHVATVRAEEVATARAEVVAKETAAGVAKSEAEMLFRILDHNRSSEEKDSDDINIINLKLSGTDLSKEELK